MYGCLCVSLLFATKEITPNFQFTEGGVGKLGSKMCKIEVKNNIFMIKWCPSCVKFSKQATMCGNITALLPILCKTCRSIIILISKLGKRCGNLAPKLCKTCGSISIKVLASKLCKTCGNINFEASQVCKKWKHTTILDSNCAKKNVKNVEMSQVWLRNCVKNVVTPQFWLRNRA